MSIRKSLKGLTVISIAVLSLRIATAQRNDSVGVEYTTKQLLTLEQTQGLPAWRQNSINYMLGAHWYFYNNGQFALEIPNYGLGVVRGTFKTENATIIFKGSAKSSAGYNGSTENSISGTIAKSANGLTLRISSETHQVTAAVVNGQGFGQSKVAAYNAVLLLNAKSIPAR